jgi:hypothetical protein
VAVVELAIVVKLVVTGLYDVGEEAPVAYPQVFGCNAPDAVGVNL